MLVVAALHPEVALRQFVVPADVSAGNALFHIVVENDEVGAACQRLREVYIIHGEFMCACVFVWQLASRILRMMNHAKLPGRVTFLPLNKLRPSQQAYPDVSGPTHRGGTKHGHPPTPRLPLHCRAMTPCRWCTASTATPSF